MKELRIEISRSDDCPHIGVLRFGGVLNPACIEEIGRSFDRIIHDEHSFVVADMSAAESISSAAIGKLMECRTRMLAREGDLVLCGLSIVNRELLTALEANKIFRFYPDLRSAINAYNWEHSNRTEEVHLSFPSQLRFVPPVRQMVSRIAAQKGYGKKDSFRIETIVDEICNNAIEHGLPEQPGPVSIVVKIDAKKVKVTVVNTSDPDKVEMLKELSTCAFSSRCGADDKRGRGLALVKMLSNDFQIDYTDGGTSVNITKLREE